MTTARKTALITGSSSGIGEGLALVCAQHQYDLILVARSVSKLEALATQLNGEYGVDVTVRPCDLSVAGNVKDLCETLLADGAQIDLLVNNAGVVEHGSFAAIPVDDHQRVVQLSLIHI